MHVPCLRSRAAPHLWLAPFNLQVKEWLQGGVQLTTNLKGDPVR